MPLHAPGTVSGSLVSAVNQRQFSRESCGDLMDPAPTIRGGAPAHRVPPVGGGARWAPECRLSGFSGHPVVGPSGPVGGSPPEVENSLSIGITSQMVRLGSPMWEDPNGKQWALVYVLFEGFVYILM